MLKYQKLITVFVLLAVVFTAGWLLLKRSPTDSDLTFEAEKAEAPSLEGLSSEAPAIERTLPEGASSFAEKIFMEITSPAFNNQESILSKYTCDGDNISPPLIISGVPKKAKSLVLIVDDPDASSGTWIHWTLWNIAASTAEIPEGRAPEEAIEGITSFEKQGYGGPCPPSDTHRYFFKLYALDKTLKLDNTARVDELEKRMEGSILETAELVGAYQRQNP